jgi:hypothetical protein
MPLPPSSSRAQPTVSRMRTVRTPWPTRRARRGPLRPPAASGQLLELSGVGWTRRANFITAGLVTFIFAVACSGRCSHLAARPGERCCRCPRDRAVRRRHLRHRPRGRPPIRDPRLAPALRQRLRRLARPALGSGWEMAVGPRLRCRWPPRCGRRPPWPVRTLGCRVRRRAATPEHRAQLPRGGRDIKVDDPQAVSATAERCREGCMCKGTGLVGHVGSTRWETTVSTSMPTLERTSWWFASVATGGSATSVAGDLPHHRRPTHGLELGSDTARQFAAGLGYADSGGWIKVYHHRLVGLIPFRLMRTSAVMNTAVNRTLDAAHMGLARSIPATTESTA